MFLTVKMNKRNCVNENENENENVWESIIIVCLTLNQSFLCQQTRVIDFNWLDRKVAKDVV
jgi:hypothetical protein